MRSASPTSSSASSAHFSDFSKRTRSIARSPALPGSSASPRCSACSAPGTSPIFSRASASRSAQATPVASDARSTSAASAPAARSQSARFSLMRATASSAPRWRGSRASTCSYASCAAVTSPSRKLLHLAEAHEQRQLRSSVTAFAGGVELRLEELGQLGVTPCLLVELRERPHRLRVRRILVEHRAQRFHRVLGRVEAFALDPGEVHAQRGALLLARRDVDEPREELRQLLVAPGARRRARGAPSRRLRRPARSRGSPRRATSRARCRFRRSRSTRAASCFRATASPPSCTSSARVSSRRTTSASSPAAARSVGELLESPDVALVLGDEVSQHRLCELGVAHGALGERLGLAQQLALGGDVALEPRPRAQRVNELPLAARGPADVLEGTEHFEVLGIDREGLAERVLGAAAVVELVLAPAGETHPELDARRRGQIGDRLEGGAEGVGCTGPSAVRVREAVELGECVLVGRILGDCGLDRSLRAPAVAHALLEHPRELEPRPRAVAHGLRPRDASLVEPRELLVRAQRAKHELQRVERVVEERVVVEQLLERLPARHVLGHALERLTQRREPLPPSRANSPICRLARRCKRSAWSHRLRLQRDAPLEDVGQGAAVAETPEEPVERGEHVRVVAGPLGRRHVRLRGARRVVELLLADLARGARRGLPRRSRRRSPPARSCSASAYRLQPSAPDRAASRSMSP